MDEGKEPNPYFEGNYDGESDELRALRLTLVHGNDALRAELKRVKDYVCTANDIITNHCIAMQAATFGKFGRQPVLAARRKPGVSRRSDIQTRLTQNDWTCRSGCRRRCVLRRRCGYRCRRWPEHAGRSHRQRQCPRRR